MRGHFAKRTSMDDGDTYMFMERVASLERMTTTVFIMGLTVMAEESPVQLPFRVGLEYQATLTMALFGEEYSPSMLPVLLRLEQYLMQSLRAFWEHLYAENPFLAQHHGQEWAPIGEFCGKYQVASFAHAVLDHRSGVRLWNMYFEKCLETLAYIPTHPVADRICEFIMMYRLLIQSIQRIQTFLPME